MQRRSIDYSRATQIKEVNDMRATRQRTLSIGILTMIALSAPVSAQGVTVEFVDSAGAVIRNARVTLFSADTVLFREARVTSGEPYRFEPLAHQEYRLGIAARGFEYQERTVVATDATDPIRFVLVPERQIGRWDTIGDPGERLGGTNSGVLMPDGRLFVCHNTIDPIIIDPATNSVRRGPESPMIQGCHAVRMLNDGRLIFAGGTDREIYGPGTRQVKTFDPRTEQWTVQPDINDYRWYPSMTQLADGELVLIGGGGRDNPIRVRTSETMDPATLLWQPAGDIATGNEVSPTVLLYTGEILMTHRPPQLYNPTTRTWRLAADFVQGNRMPNGYHCDHEAVVLADGTVVAFGHEAFPPDTIQSVVERYDPVADKWTLGRDTRPHRARAGALMLPDQTVLLIAGEKEDSTDPTPVNEWGFMRITDQYVPSTDSWRRLADLNIAREYHNLPILVPDGRVITVGGEGQPGNEPDSSMIEAFYPPYLFRGVRPRIESISDTILHRGAVVHMNIDRTSSPTHVMLLGTSATTHFMESGNARCIEVPFTYQDGMIRATLSTDRNLLPIGYYELFVMVDDIPSVGRIVRVDRALPIRVNESRGSRPLVATFPSPATNEVAITFGSSDHLPTIVAVFDLLGRLVWQSTIEPGSVGGSRVVWNCSSVPAGRYMVETIQGSACDRAAIAVIH
jgi:hypothetical protein